MNFIKKKTILISYPSMMIGGSTTSLLSILSRLDFKKYEVDLLLDVVSGDLLGLVPSDVNILDSAYTYPDHKKRKLHNILNYKYMYAFLISKYIAFKSGNIKCGVQYLESQDVENYRDINKHYDIAISFIEGRNCKFIVNHISATKKIGWIHIDYKSSNFNPEYDLECMSRLDTIVTVSQSCKNSFDECFPSLKNRTCVIENILSDKFIRQRSQIPVDCGINHNNINLVTTCRIVFSSKGLDRAVSAMANSRHLSGFNNIKWYIIGDGTDMPLLKELIIKNNLTDSIILLGNKTNPYPYIKQMDLFFLPSLWEGKPMAVTEAFMLGLPVLATKYLSAQEQIRDGIDGIIVENSQKGIEDGLKNILLHPEKISELRHNVVMTDYSNDDEMKKIISLIDN